MDNPANHLYHNQAPSVFLFNQIALLCVDLQYHDAAVGYGLMKGVQRDDPRFIYYFDRLEHLVLPNVKRMQAAFRRQNQEVIHVRIEALTKDGRDRSTAHKRIDCLVAKGSKEAEFLPEVAPQGDEIMISKTSSGVFNSTNIEYVLKNLGITQLVVVGVLTNECIETTVRDASDRGFITIVASDATAAFSEQLQEASLTNLHGTYTTVATTDAIIDKLVPVDEKNYA